MKKKDFLIAAAVLLLAGILALVFRFAGGDPGGSVRVKVDGKVVGTYALVEGQRVPFDTKYGHNTLVIEGGKAHIEDADCPDHYCMKRGFCSGGTQIVCLPNRLVIQFVDEQTVDAVVG